MPNSLEHIKDAGKPHNKEASLAMFITKLSQSLVDNFCLSSFQHNTYWKTKELVFYKTYFGANL